MSIQSVRTTVPRRDRSSAILDEAKVMARSTLDRIAARRSQTRPEAITTLSRSAGIAGGTLENLLRDRLKHISAADYAALREACVAEIIREIEALDRELRLARARGTHVGAGTGDIREAEAALATARTLIARIIPD